MQPLWEDCDPEDKVNHCSSDSCKCSAHNGGTKKESIAANGIAKPPETLPKLTPEQKQKLIQRMDLSGTHNWSIEEQAEDQDLIKEYGSLFALDSQNLGCTSVVKHSTTLTDYTPLKVKYIFLHTSMKR